MVRLDPALKLALSIYENKGVYALLIGSGVSRSAGISTGWEVTLDLIRKIARVDGTEELEDPVQWYRERFGRDPNYADLLKELANTPAERRALLAGYFEPTEEEREQGLKVPSDAHRSIARLVKNGYVRVILTTNFDRLIEDALEAEGVNFNVARSAHDIRGLEPYAHGRPLLIKLHGDYRDARIKNTPTELARYSDGVNSLLDRLLDDFGLVVCGWSGEHDRALRDAISRRAQRRYSIFWLTRSDLSSDMRELANNQRAETLRITSADEFFAALHQRITSLEEDPASHPASIPVAVATVKRYVSEGRFRIALDDFMTEETESVMRVIEDDRFSAFGTDATKENFQERMRQYEALSKQLVATCGAIAYYDQGDNDHLLERVIRRLLNVPSQDGRSLWVDLQYYPALLVTYGAGIPALAQRKFSTLLALLHEPQYRQRQGQGQTPAIDRTHSLGPFYSSSYKWVPRPNAEQAYTPVSEHLLDMMWEMHRTYLPDRAAYEETFDIFEFLISLTYLDLIKDTWVPIGRYWWNWEPDETSPGAEFIAEGLRRGGDWALLGSGFFGGSVERLQQILARQSEYMREHNKMRW